MREPFVEGWDFVEILGEGAFGQVKLAFNISTNEHVAVKIINHKADMFNYEDLKKEISIHRLLDNQFIVKMYGTRTEGSTSFIFLEYACGGELFDRIEPDVGMNQKMAHRFFTQILLAVEYLHSKGITHRDIKPENILLDGNECIKLTDFGLSTLFCFKGVERLLNRPCGTPPYLAPEIIASKEYHAKPADIWSCGIVLVGMLTGELPWDEPRSSCKEFIDWTKGICAFSPFNRLNIDCLQLIKSMLNVNPTKRATLLQIRSNVWFTKKFSEESVLDNHEIIQSQPDISHFISQTMNISRFDSSDINNYISFSQPIRTDDMILSSQVNPSQSFKSFPANFSKRMTRFNICSLSMEDFLKKMTDFLIGIRFQIKMFNKSITVTAIDYRKLPLGFVIHLRTLSENHSMVDFMLTKGDGIEFKRIFGKIKQEFDHFII